MCGDNGGRIASHTLHLRIQPNDTEVKHCYKHQGSYLWLGPSVSNRLLAFATQTKVLTFSANSYHQDKVNSSWRRCDINKAVTSKSIQPSRFCPSQSLPRSTTPDITGANQTSSSKLSAKGPSSRGKKLIKTTQTNLQLTNFTRHPPYRIDTTARCVRAPYQGTVLGQDNAKLEDCADRTARNKASKTNLTRTSQISSPNNRTSHFFFLPSVK
jgi:hypothetical protein